LPEHFDEDLSKNSHPAVRILINEPALKGSEILLMELFELMRIYAKQPFPMQVKIEKIYKPGRGGTLHYILPLWILLTIMGSLVITTSSLIEEKDRKTLDALLVSPASIYDFITGKALLGIILSFSSAFLLLVLNRSLTGNLPVLFSMLLLGGIFFSCWGIFVAFISPSQSTANSINSLAFICLMVPIVLSENSSLLRSLSGCLPSYYLVDGITKGLEGNCSGLFFNYLVLGGGSILLFALCLNVINRQET
ncbi:MAG: ABC transporter permease, partial [Candidatus Eremiobacterota bacterium]